MADGIEVPTALVAVTLKRYAVPLINGVSTHEVAPGAGVQLTSGESGTPSTVSAMTL